MTALQSSALQTSYVPQQNVIPSYLYQEYATDETLQAFVTSQNNLTQQYLSWFNETPLSVYTSASISGALLDWIGQGIYGIARPVLSTQSSLVQAGYNAFFYNQSWYNGLLKTSSGTAQLASDDIYKRTLTWHLYRGDGQQFSIFWLKRRVARFLLGVNGGDADVLSNPPSVTVSGSTYTITTPTTTSAQAFGELVANASLALPFQYTFDVVLT